MSILNDGHLMWLTIFLFLAISAAAAKSAAPLLCDVGIPRSVRHQVVSNANHLMHKLMLFLPRHV